MTAEGGGNGGESLGEEKKKTIHWWKEKKRREAGTLWEWEWREIVRKFFIMKAGRWQGGSKGGEAEDDGIGTGWLPHFYFSAMIQICIEEGKKIHKEKQKWYDVSLKPSQLTWNPIFYYLKPSIESQIKLGILHNQMARSIPIYSIQ